MVILNLSESLAKPLVMAKLNMAYLSSLKNRAKLPHCRCKKTEQRYGNFKLIRITCQAACHGKIKHGIFVKLKKPSKTAFVDGVKKPSSAMVILNLSESLAKPLVMVKLNKAYWSSLKNRPNCLIAGVKKPSSVMVILNLSESLAKPLVMAKIEHGIFVKFKKPSKTASSLVSS